MKFTKKQIKKIIEEELASFSHGFWRQDLKELDASDIEPPVASTGTGQDGVVLRTLTPEQSADVENMADAIKAMAQQDKEQIEVILAQLSTEALS